MEGRLAMKKSLSCAELGVAGCTFEARSEVKEEIKDALLFHAGKTHPQMMADMSDKEKQDMALQIDKMIK